MSRLRCSQEYLRRNLSDTVWYILGTRHMQNLVFGRVSPHFYKVLISKVVDMSASNETAILAGGCFWGMQDLLRRLPGVISTRVGYTGGELPNATYEQLKTGRSGHAEAIEMTFDPTRITFRQILETFFQIHDPTTVDRQGNDRGSQYRSAIFWLNESQKRTAEDTIADVEASGLWPGKVVTELKPAGAFWLAEPEHQDYLLRYPNGYTCHFPRPNWVLPKRTA